jgi:hypothetical protein
MSLKSAQRFILQASEDAGLRSRLNRAKTRSELAGILEQTVGEFSFDVFEEAFRSMHVKCQTEEQAMELKEIRLWWQFLLMNSLEDNSEQSTA